MAPTRPFSLPSVLLMGTILGAVLTVFAQKVAFEQHGESYPLDRILEDVEIPDEETETSLETAVVCIIVFLIVVTIAFEEGKVQLEKAASPNMRPVLAALFGELTILGFLSACTFVITQTEWPNHVSEQVFHDPHLLVELFEQLHYSVFFIMVAYMLQVLLLVHQSMKTERTWDRMEQRASTTAEDNLFSRLRKEFVLERSAEPPFEPSSSRLPDDFRFGRYLSICLGRNMAHVVDISVASWGFILLVIMLFYELMLAVHYDMLVLSWIWTGMGWLVLACTIIFERYVHRIMEAFAAPENDTPGANGVNEQDPLIPPRWTQIPKWCHIDLEEYLANRSRFMKFISPEEPNRQDAMFMMELKGHEFNLWFLQIVFIFVAMYITVCYAAFLPILWPLFGDNTLVLVVYLVLYLLPALLIQSRCRRLVAITSIVGCTSTTRRQHGVISQVLQDQRESHL